MERCADSHFLDDVDQMKEGKVEADIADEEWPFIVKQEKSNFDCDSGDYNMAFQMYKYKTHLKVEYEGDGIQNNIQAMPSSSRSLTNCQIETNNHSQYKCDTCGKLCLNSELHESFQVGTMKYYCYDCVDKLTEELMKPGEKASQNLYQQCTSCSRSFNYSNRVINQSGEPFCCDFCVKKFECSSSERKPKNSKREKMFECDVCMKEFTQLAHVKTHKLIHSGEKSFECEICSKRFTRKSGLDVHKLIHTGEKSYKCDICSMRFVQPSHLKTHKLTHTGERSFECDVCFKKFGRKSGLDIHKLTHTGEKSYECDVCLKKFIQPSHLNTHKLIHTGERPFECGICTKKYNRAALLRKHELSHR